MKKVVLLCLLTPLLLYSEPEDELQGSVDTGEVRQSGQACKDYMRSRNWNEGENDRKGKKIFISMSTDSSAVNPSRVAYIDSIQNAFIRAQMKAKTEISEFLGKQIKSEIQTVIKQASKDGKKPVMLVLEQDNEAETYEDLSAYQKMKVLLHQKLDEHVSQENKDKVGLDEKELGKQVDRILNQKVFQDSIEATAKANIRGMKIIYSSLHAQPDTNRTTVCTVAAWSNNQVKWADAMYSGNFSALRNLKKGKPLRDYIPTNPETLLVTFGAMMVRNEKGEMSVLSFSQEGLKSSSQMSEEIAFEGATLKAERAILQLRSENVEVSQKTDTFEVTSEYANGVTDTYSETNQENRRKAAANGSLQGSNVLETWLRKHPVSGKLVAGVVVGWSPSSADFARSMKETLDQDPDSGGTDYSPSPTQVNGKEVDSGSAIGDDEDDF